jgi:hypothetical protein
MDLTLGSSAPMGQILIGALAVPPIGRAWAWTEWGDEEPIDPLRGPVRRWMRVGIIGENASIGCLRSSRVSWTISLRPGRSFHQVMDVVDVKRAAIVSQDGW